MHGFIVRKIPSLAKKYDILESTKKNNNMSFNNNLYRLSFSGALFAIMSTTSSQVLSLTPPHVEVRLPPLIWSNSAQGFKMPLFNGNGIANCQARSPLQCKRLLVGDEEWQDMPSAVYESDWSWGGAMHFGTKSLYMGGMGGPGEYTSVRANNSR